MVPRGLSPISFDFGVPDAQPLVETWNIQSKHFKQPSGQFNMRPLESKV